jgi:predicted nucleic acid-binding protein
MDRVFHLCDKSGDLVVVSTYVTASALALDGVLVTADARLSRASGVHCEIETIDGA